MTGSVLEAGYDVIPKQVVAPHNLEACQDLCDGIPGCKSVRYCPNTGTCFIKDKILTGTEDVQPAACIASYQTTCKDRGNEDKVSKYLSIFKSMAFLIFTMYITIFMFTIDVLHFRSRIPNLFLRKEENL